VVSAAANAARQRHDDRVSLDQLDQLLLSLHSRFPCARQQQAACWGVGIRRGIATTTAVRYLEYILIHVYIEIQLYYYLDYIYSQKSTQRAL
jgi:hypothetical protein